MAKRMVLRGDHAFFFLWPGFIDFFYFFWWFHGYFCNKSWNQGGFMKCENKISWNHLGIRLGPRAGAEAGAEREARSGGRSGGPRAQPDAQVVSTYFFSHFMNTTLISRFICKISVNTNQKNEKNQWNPGHKNKKICAVLAEILLWWYFGQKYSYHRNPDVNIEIFYL